MAFGFSVTDFVRAIELVVDLSDALCASGDARARIRELIGELYALKRALLEVKRLNLDAQLKADECALRAAAAHCQVTIDDFWKKVKHLQPHLQHTGTGSLTKDVWARMTWALCKKEDVEHFRAAIRGHTACIEILLSSVQLHALQLEGKKRQEQKGSLVCVIQDFATRTMTKLSVITLAAAESYQQGKALFQMTVNVLNKTLQVFAIVCDMHNILEQLACSGAARPTCVPHGSVQQNSTVCFGVHNK